MKIELLKDKANKGDNLAAYYLGKYYLEEKHNIDQSIYWLLKANAKDSGYGAYVLGQLSVKYPTKFWKIKKQEQNVRKCK